MPNKNTQIRAKMIAQYPKTDREKLAGFERLIHRKFPNIAVSIEPFMIFSKGEDEYMGTRDSLDRVDSRKYVVHPPDMILFIKNRKVVFELDGDWHINHTSKDFKRDQRLRDNNIEFFIINESELREKLGVTKLTQEQLDLEFTLRIKEFINCN